MLEKCCFKYFLLSSQHRLKILSHLHTLRNSEHLADLGDSRFFLFRFLSLTAVLNTAFVNSWDNFLVLGDLWMTSSKIQNVLSLRDGRASFCHQVISTLLFLPDLDRAVLKCSPSRYDRRIVREFLQPFRYALISVNFLGPRSVNC